MTSRDRRWLSNIVSDAAYWLRRVKRCWLSSVDHGPNHPSPHSSLSYEPLEEATAIFVGLI